MGWGVLRSEVKEEGRAKPGPGDMSGAERPGRSILPTPLSETAENKSHPPMRNVMGTEGDRHVLRLQEHLVTPGAALTPRARRLGAAKRLPQVAHILRVHETHACFHGSSHAVCLADVLSPDIARQPVGD